ncbi:MAG: peroxidase family protein [Hyphomicrobiaceae bacterium]
MSFVSFLFRILNRFLIWHRLPFLLSVANLVTLQHDLRWRNLFATARNNLKAQDPGDFDVRQFRTADGSYNDLDNPEMGMAMMRFGRNVPLERTYAETEPRLMTPNPRDISNKLLARKEFIPVPHLNVLTGAWLQFMVHDWLSHGDNDPQKMINVPVPKYDNWSGHGHKPGHLSVRATLADEQTNEQDVGMPATYRNRATHWWDGSQIYGNNQQRVTEMRSDPHGNIVPGGKLYLDRRGLMQLQRSSQVELAGENGNWWIGLSLFTNLFMREHNVIADHLRAEYRHESDEWVFQKARLINAALMTKIHAVEWTPAILDTPALRYAMRGNWWGVLGEEYEKAYGRDKGLERITGIPGSKSDHHGAPYSITEEFTAVYRMHSLVPDEFQFVSVKGNQHIETRNLAGVAGRETHSIYQKATIDDAFYSLAIANCGALVLHNFPNELRNLTKQGRSADRSEHRIDLATIDILRDRERGVPRYTEFRNHLRMPVPRTFLQLTGGDQERADELAAIYEHVDDVDLLVGCLAEKPPKGFGFSDTAFRIFVVMATRRIKSDRFYTDDYHAGVYTQFGMDWVCNNGLHTVVSRHFPSLAKKIGRVRNGFFPWPKD